MKKKPTLYVIIICLWTCCLAVLGFAFSWLIIGLNDYSAVKKAFVIALLTINTIVLAVLWFGSIKDFVFSVSYAVLRKKLNDKYADIKESSDRSASKKVRIDPQNAPRVLLLYCTCNDFNAKALTACRKQDYPNFKTVILDDSNKFEYIKEINKFYVQHQNVEIVKLNGSVELAPIVGLSEVIVDIVETGSTLRENGLEVLEEICPLSARVIVNEASMKMQRERITKIVKDLKNTLTTSEN